jgi:hypothetical protein
MLYDRMFPRKTIDGTVAADPAAIAAATAGISPSPSAAAAAAAAAGLSRSQPFAGAAVAGGGAAAAASLSSAGAAGDSKDRCVTPTDCASLLLSSLRTTLTLSLS